MSSLKFSLQKLEKGRKMFFSESLTIDQEDLAKVALAAESEVAYTYENKFIERLKLGDEAAFNELVTVYSSSIYSLLFRLTGNSEDAKDLTQDTFLRVVKSVKSFRGESGIKTWLFRIAINESKNRWRWWKRRKIDLTDSIDAESEFSELTLKETLASNSPNPEEITLKLERQAQLNKALGELSKKFKEVVILRDIEGLDYEQIAIVLDTNIGTVKSRLSRGREELRKKLGGF
jgi:RNA polymerase sigma-70 factor, ECF subfamily